jgi:uncharacterized protein (TIGR02678 family)
VIAEAERRRALRALLRTPLLPSAGDTVDEYILVRRHSEWLKSWFTKFPAWTLHIDKAVARLRKVPVDLCDETRPAVDRISGTSFSRRTYSLLCLTLATLEGSEQQTTLGKIAQQIMEVVADDQGLRDAGLNFDIGNYDQRRDLVHAIRLLLDSGVLRKLDGDEEEFLNRTGSSDVLYEIDRRILVAMLNVSRSPSFAKNASELIDDPIPEAVDARSQWIRARLVRTLLDDPILYYEDLNDEERIYLEQHRGYLLRQITEATGLTAEVRREGIALVDHEGDLSDIHLVDEGTDGYLSLLLVQRLAEHARNCPGVAVPVTTLEEDFRGLTEDTLLRLRALRLIELKPEGVVPLAACGRYASQE